MKKFKRLLFFSGRLLSVVFVVYYAVVFLTTLFSGVRYQFIHNPTWVAVPFIVGTIGLLVGYSVYFAVSLRKSQKAYKLMLSNEKEKEEAQDVKSVLQNSDEDGRD